MCSENPGDLDDDRYATQRGSYLSRTLDLRKKPAKAIAYSELGYSRSAIADTLDTGESTVKSWHERAMALYGLELCEWHVEPDAEPPSYDRVEPGYHQSRPDGDVWVEFVDRYQNRLPQEWVNDVLSSARDDGVGPSFSDT